MLYNQGVIEIVRYAFENALKFVCRHPAYANSRYNLAVHVNYIEHLRRLYRAWRDEIEIDTNAAKVYPDVHINSVNGGHEEIVGCYLKSLNGLIADISEMNEGSVELNLDTLTVETYRVFQDQLFERILMKSNSYK